MQSTRNAKQFRAASSTKGATVTSIHLQLKPRHLIFNYIDLPMYFVDDGSAKGGPACNKRGGDDGDDFFLGIVRVVFWVLGLGLWVEVNVGVWSNLGCSLGAGERERSGGVHVRINV